MPQLQLPLFPAGSKGITGEIGVHCQDGKVVYVCGHLPVFQHDAGDLGSFRMFTSQMVVNGTAKAGQIAATFGVPLATVKRYAAIYRLSGAKGFFETKARFRSETKLTEEVKEQARKLLEEGMNVAAVGKELSVQASTLHKAIRSQRLQFKKKK